MDQSREPDRPDGPPGEDGLRVWQLVTALEGVEETEEILRLGLSALPELVPASMSAACRPQADPEWRVYRNGRELNRKEVEAVRPHLLRIPAEGTVAQLPGRPTVCSGPEPPTASLHWHALDLKHLVVLPLSTVGGREGHLFVGRRERPAFTAVERQHLKHFACFLAARLDDG